MRRVTAKLLVLALGVLPLVAMATTPSVELGKGWSLGVLGQYRPRLMTHTGLDLVEDGRTTRNHIDQRVRLGTLLSNEAGVKFQVVLQDIRAWGEETNTLNDFSANGFDVHEAFAILPIIKGLNVKIGRQEINLDNHRLIGNVGWSQRARSFDAVKVHFNRYKVDLSAYYARVTEDDKAGGAHVGDLDGNPAGGGFDNYWAGFRAYYGGLKAVKGSLTYLAVRNGATDSTRHTAGLYLKGGLSGLSYTGEFYYQFGSEQGVDKDGKPGSQSVGAMLAAVSVGYTLPVATKPMIKAWFEYVGGNEDGLAQNAFMTPFPTNHKFYGEIDYFLNTIKHTKALGLMDIGGRLQFQPTNWLKAYADFHYFKSSASDKTISGGATDNSTYGMEIDAKLIFKVMDNVNIRAFYGVFMPDDLMKTMRGLAQDTKLQNEHLFYLTTDIKI